MTESDLKMIIGSDECGGHWRAWECMGDAKQHRGRGISKTRRRNLVLILVIMDIVFLCRITHEYVLEISVAPLADIGYIAVDFLENVRRHMEEQGIRQGEIIDMGTIFAIDMTFSSDSILEMDVPFDGY